MTPMKETLMMTMLLRYAVFVGLTLSAAASAWAQSGAAPVSSWQIAFLRDGNIWLMNADGSGQRKWRTQENIMGNLSWAPDGKRVAYVRRGEFTYSLPDGGGGTHRLYDVFASHIDSTRDDFWWWVTFNHGSRTPEWSSDGRHIMYTRDINANTVDAELPDLKIEYAAVDGSEVVSLNRQGALPRECQGTDPTWSPDRRQVAFIYHKAKAPSGTGGGALETIGLVVVSADGIVESDQELEQLARLLTDVAGPAWSPDGKWICYVDTKRDDGGIYRVSPDGKIKEKIVARADRLVPYQGKPSWSPDSRLITFASTDGFIYLADADGKTPPRRVTSNGNDYFPAISPK
ncbi:MAG TPA: hypothetical protein VGB22_05865 [candidate division Zixibacteria bacterium]